MYVLKKISMEVSILSLNIGIPIHILYIYCMLCILCMAVDILIDD
jgi:hypothetical protein